MLPLPIEKLYLDGDEPITEDITCLKELDIINLDKIIPSILHLANFPYLNTLSIHHSTITEDNVHIIANFIIDSQLLKLELYHCAIEYDSLIAIINAIERSSLQTLKIGNVHFKTAEAAALSNAIEQSPLTKLSFAACEFDQSALILIMDAIKQSKVRTLILHRAHFNVETTPIIADCIVGAKLTKLSLRFANFMRNIQDMNNMVENGKCIIDAIKQSSLHILDVRNVALFNDFDTINDLASNCSFTKLEYSAKMLNAEEKYAILISVQQNHSLKHCSFDGTKFTDRLITKLCDLIKGSRFTSFDLDYDSLPTAVINQIMDAIKQSSIVSLTFSEFGMKVQNIMVVRNLLETFNFAKLKLHFFSFENEIIEQMLPSVQQSTITRIDIGGIGSWTRMDDKLRYKIESIMQLRKQHHMKSARSALPMQS